MDGGIGDDTGAAVGLGLAGLELGFDEGDDAAAGPDQGGERGKDLPQGDERAIGDGEVEGQLVRGEVGGGQLPGIGPFEDGDAWVLAEFPGELAMADIDGMNGVGAVLEEAVGEPAGTGAEIEGAETGYRDGEVEEGVLEFMAAPGNEPFRGDQFQMGIGGGGIAGFAGGLPIDPDLTGEDGGLGLGACGAEATFDEALVQAGHGGQAFRPFTK